MTKNYGHWALIGAACLLLGACSSSTPSRGLPPLTAAPTEPVQSSDLPPPEGAPTALQDGEAQTAEEQQSASATPPAPPPPSDQPIQQTDVLGQWMIASASATCTANVTLTGWNGGYRASTRNCGDPALKALGAWNIENNQVVLKDMQGTPIAILNRTGATRFDGQFNAGGPVSLVR